MFPLQSLTDGCVSEGLAPAVESALAVLTALQPFLPPTNITQHAKWARKVCVSGLNDAASVPLTKTLLTLYLKLSRRAELDLEAVRCHCVRSPRAHGSQYRALAKNLHAVLGDLNGPEERTPPNEWRQFELVSNNKAALAAMAVLLHQMEELFTELEWALSVAAGDGAKRDGALELYERVFSRLTHCAPSPFLALRSSLDLGIEVLQHATRTSTHAQTGDLVLKALIRMYKFAAKLVKTVRTPSVALRLTRLPSTQSRSVSRVHASRRWRTSSALT